MWSKFITRLADCRLVTVICKARDTSGAWRATEAVGWNHLSCPGSTKGGDFVTGRVLGPGYQTCEKRLSVEEGNRARKGAGCVNSNLEVKWVILVRLADALSPPWSSQLASRSNGLIAGRWVATVLVLLLSPCRRYCTDGGSAISGEMRYKAGVLQTWPFSGWLSKTFTNTGYIRGMRCCLRHCKYTILLLRVLLCIWPVKRISKNNWIQAPSRPAIPQPPHRFLPFLLRIKISTGWRPGCEGREIVCACGQRFISQTWHGRKSDIGYGNGNKKEPDSTDNETS